MEEEKRERERTYGDDDTAAADDLSWLALLIDLAQARPFAQFLVVVDLLKQEINIYILRR